MRLITTMLALLLASSGAWAEWVKVSEHKDTVFYFDPTTIRKDGNLRRVWELQDFKQRIEVVGLSIRSRGEYDCWKERSRTISIFAHSGPMATGETLVRSSDPGEWKVVSPGTPGGSILKLVCSK